MSGKRQKHEEHEEHVNHERWLVTYADMITLLMVLFIVLFAMGQTDLAKYKKLKTSLATGFGGPDKMALLDGGAGINSGGASPAGVVPSEIAAKAALTTLEKRSTAWKAEKAKLNQAATALQESLQGAKSAHLIEDSQIKVAVDSRGLIITISSDVVLFAPGSATLQAGGQRVLDRLASQLAALPNQITVEGHTDDVPISGTYPSNWELSTARASSVLRSFIERHGLPASRGSATGYADQKPIASNDTAKGRAQNRRVEIIVVASVADPNVDSAEAVALADRTEEAQSAETSEPVDLSGIDETETDETSTDEHSTDETATDEHATDELSTDESGAEETPADEAAAETGTETGAGETVANEGADGSMTAEAGTEAASSGEAASTTIDPSTPTTTEDLRFTPIPELTQPSRPTAKNGTSGKASATTRPPVTFTPSPLSAGNEPTATSKTTSKTTKAKVKAPVTAATVAPTVTSPGTTGETTNPSATPDTTTGKELIISPPVKPIA